MKVEVRLNEKEFFRFSTFDVLRLRKRWRSPAVFAAILCACAAVCFLMRHVRGAVVLGIALLVAGIGIPAAYFLNFFLSLRRQARQEGLSPAKYVYTLDLGGDGGIAVDNGHEHAVYPWGQVFHVYRNTSASYLYITPQRAFLLPHDCVKGGADALWKLFEARLPADRRTVLHH